MHNVVARNTQALPGYLGLSNTLKSCGSLSFSKPPHRFIHFVTFLMVLDGIRLPGRVIEGTLQGSVNSVPRGTGNKAKPVPQ